MAHIRPISVVASTVLAFLLTTSVVLADYIEFTDYTVTCSSVSFSYVNTTDPQTSHGADAALVRIENLNTSETLYEDYLNPYYDGDSITFPEQPAGSIIQISVEVSDEIFGFMYVPCTPAEASGSGTRTIIAPPCNNLFDGRINRSPARDCAAPVAIYYDEANGQIVIYGIDPETGTGKLAGVIALSGDAAGATTLATAHPWFSASLVVTRLSTGEWQLSTTYADGKPYVVVWSTPDDLYHLAA